MNQLVCSTKYLAHWVQMLRIFIGLAMDSANQIGGSYLGDCPRLSRSPEITKLRDKQMFASVNIRTERLHLNSFSISWYCKVNYGGLKHAKVSFLMEGRLQQGLSIDDLLEVGLLLISPGCCNVFWTIQPGAPVAEDAP